MIYSVFKNSATMDIHKSTKLHSSIIVEKKEAQAKCC